MACTRLSNKMSFLKRFLPAYHAMNNAIKGTRLRYNANNIAIKGKQLSLNAIIIEFKSSE